MFATPRSPSAFGDVARAALNVLLPPRCLKCGCLVEAPGTLCADCWGGLDFLGPPYCAACGFPFEFEAGDGALCTSCTVRPPPFERARAAFRYDETSRGLILAFKHGDRTDAAPAFARWLRRAGAEVLAEADLLVPVPLHWTRLFRRRYNQAALLADGLGALAGLAVAREALVRRRRTPSQGAMGAGERRRNVRGAFAPGGAGAAAVAGRRIVLVDDVLTTGATAGECTRVLRGAGAAAVDVLTLARVVRPEP